jgi:hypothetical protein
MCGRARSFGNFQLKANGSDGITAEVLCSPSLFHHFDAFSGSAVSAIGAAEPLYARKRVTHTDARTRER